MDRDRLDTIARAHGILLLLQHGSSVTGRMHEGSDLDLAVLLERMPDTFEAYAELLGDLQSLVPDREVDVVAINRADPLLLERVTSRGRLLWGDPRRFAELKIYAFKRYQDHRRYLDLERQYLDRQLSSPR